MFYKVIHKQPRTRKSLTLSYRYFNQAFHYVRNYIQTLTLDESIELWYDGVKLYQMDKLKAVENTTPYTPTT